MPSQKLLEIRSRWTEWKLDEMIRLHSNLQVALDIKALLEEIDRLEAHVRELKQNVPDSDLLGDDELL